jgi:hypothetical protein
MGGRRVKKVRITRAVRIFAEKISSGRLMEPSCRPA